MYNKTEIFLIIGCVIISGFGLIGILNQEKKKKDEVKYQNDDEGKKKILKYFKDNKAIDKEHGIAVDDIPKEMLDSGYISKMFMDDLLDYDDEKYFIKKN